MWTGHHLKVVRYAVDTERGYVANSVWRVESISGDSVTLNDGKSTRTVTPAADKAEAHVDLAYAITTHGAQGASEPFSIELEGVTGARERMVSFESAYVPELQDAIDTLKVWWPGLFKGEAPHLLAIGIREAFFEDIAERGIPLSHKQAIKCLKSITRSELYLSSMIAGAERVDLHGNPVSVVTPDEEKYAQLRLEKQRQQQARIQNEII